MAFWLVQAQDAQEEQYFINSSRICCTEDSVQCSILDFYAARDLSQHIEDECGVDSATALSWSEQCWPFAHSMFQGDYVALITHGCDNIHFGRITGEYNFNEEQEARHRHERSVVWFARGVSRAALSAKGRELFDVEEQISEADGYAFLDTIIDAYKYVIPAAAARRLVFDGTNADEIFALTVDTDGSSPERVRQFGSPESQRIVAPRVEAPKKRIAPVERGATATSAAAVRLYNAAPDIASAREMMMMRAAAVRTAEVAAASASKAADRAEESRKSLEERLASLICQKVRSHELNLTSLIENIIRAKGFSTSISSEGNVRNTTLIASSRTNRAVKVGIQIQNYACPLKEQCLDLMSTMMTFHSAGHAVLVSMSGFDQSVMDRVKESKAKVKLWAPKDIATEVLACYDRLDDNIRATLPRSC